jgi:hypothetical protein
MRKLVAGDRRVNVQNALLAKIEAAGLWAYLHKDWLLPIRDQMRLQLPNEYCIFLESETILIAPDRPASPQAVLPDVSVSRRDLPEQASQSGHAPQATAAVIEREEPCEVFSQYRLVIRRAPERQVVAVMELLSPSNKGVGNRFDRDKHLRNRDAYLESGVTVLEIDALLEGERVLPASLQELASYERSAWTAFHSSGSRKLRGWGWNTPDPLPVISWAIEASLEVLVDLPSTFEQACDFNRWQDLVDR